MTEKEEGVAVASAAASATNASTTSTAAIDDNSNKANTATSQGTSSSMKQQSKRLDHTTCCVPIVYGSIAYYLGKKADEFQTHEWTLYVRGPNYEDLSQCISKVIFQLHASFAQPFREITQPPFEVTERGWGEFEAQIRIVWKDPDEKSTVIPHGIKLYPPGTPVTNTIPESSTQEPVVAEQYEEVVFTNPKESFFRQLQRLAHTVPPPRRPKTRRAADGDTSAAADNEDDEDEDPASAGGVLTSSALVRKNGKVFCDTDMVQALIAAQSFLKTEIARVRDQLILVDKELETTDQDLIKQQEYNAANPKAAAKAKTTKSSSGSSPSKSKTTKGTGTKPKAGGGAVATKRKASTLSPATTSGGAAGTNKKIKTTGGASSKGGKTAAQATPRSSSVVGKAGSSGGRGATAGSTGKTSKGSTGSSGPTKTLGSGKK